MPSNAISRVIGRGGSNINAIRELSGAHIEVEKKSTGQGDRTIIIKGSADATRMANTWISSIIANPDKDLQEIVGKQQYKLLSKSVLDKAAAVTASKQPQAVVMPPAAKGTIVASSTRGTSKADTKKAVPTVTAATISTATKVTTAFNAPVVSSNAKTVISASFAAIAAGNDTSSAMGGMSIQTGPPPASASNKLPTFTSAVAAQQQSKAQLLHQQQQMAAAAKAQQMATAAAVQPQQQPIGKPTAAMPAAQLSTQQQQQNKKEDKVSIFLFHIFHQTIM